jgi:DNA-binding NarL/FixJ family response regulator
LLARAAARENPDAVRIVIGEDSVLLREGLANLLESRGFEVVARAGDADDLLRKVRAHKPDVAIVDIRMPPLHADDGIQAAHTIRVDLPETGVLVLSQYAEEEYATQLLSDGAEGVGYLLKDRIADVDAFVDAIRRVARGGSALDPQIVAALLDRRRPEDSLADLTPKEREVLALMAEGLTNQGIAERLVVTESAVERHVTGIFSKLRLDAMPHGHRRVLAVLRFLQS